MPAGASVRIAARKADNFVLLVSETRGLEFRATFANGYLNRSSRTARRTALDRGWLSSARRFMNTAAKYGTRPPLVRVPSSAFPWKVFRDGNQTTPRPSQAPRGVQVSNSELERWAKTRNANGTDW
jgi:hypothetical protein